MSQYPSPSPMQVIPVTPSYAQPLGSARPGAVTVIGVISIVLASIALFTNAASGIFGLVSLGTTKIQQVSVKFNDVTRYSLTPPESESAPGAMSDTDADAVAEGLSRAQTLSAPRKAHVVKLARVHGKKILPFATNGVVAAVVRGNVSSTHRQASSSGAPEDVYVLGEGTLRVNDFRAVFEADNGNAYRSNDPAQDNSISEEGIDRMTRELVAYGVTPNAAQRLSIRELLRDPQQQIVSHNAAATVVAAGPLKDGGLWFTTSQAQVRLDNSGKATLLNAAAPEPGTNPLTGRPLTTRWANLLMLESLGSGLLAVFLLIGGIFLLRGRPVGRKFCVMWAMIKFPLAIAGAVFLGMAINEWIAALSSDDATPTRPSFAPVVMGSVTGLAGLAWALIVLVALTRPSVRDHFKNVM